MSKDQAGDLGNIVMGVITSAGVGSVMMESLGVLAMGAIGALGAHLFNKLLKKKVDALIYKLRTKLSCKKSKDKA